LTPFMTSPRVLNRLHPDDGGGHGLLANDSSRNGAPTMKNRLFYGDNLPVLREHVATESVDLVYLDPPFNSNRSYSVIFGEHARKDADANAQIQAFDDTWHWDAETERLFRDLLLNAPTAVGDAMQAFRTLVGDSDALAY